MKKEKHPGGRPTLYKPEYCERMLDYFSIKPYTTLEIKDNQGQTVQSKPVPNLFPTLARFAVDIGVTRDTLYEWSTAKNEDESLKYPEFSYAYKKAKEYQEANLVEGTLNGAYQQTFAIFAAKNILGWRDKTEQELTGSNGGPVRIVAMNNLDEDA
jgi:hypothetical protein